jgi:hypothetical protein
MDARSSGRTPISTPRPSGRPPAGPSARSTSSTARVSGRSTNSRTQSLLSLHSASVVAARNYSCRRLLPLLLLPRSISDSARVPRWRARTRCLCIATTGAAEWPFCSSSISLGQGRSTVAPAFMRLRKPALPNVAELRAQATSAQGVIRRTNRHRLISALHIRPSGHPTAPAVRQQRPRLRGPAHDRVRVVGRS